VTAPYFASTLDFALVVLGPGREPRVDAGSLPE
jgi:hypothetical protein